MATPGIAVPGTNVPSGSGVSPGGAQGVQGLQGIAAITGFMSKTAAYTLTAADSSKYVICSGGSWTLTLPAPAAGLSFSVRNDMGISGTTGTITIATNGGTLDGLASILLLPQQEATIICDGTNWRSFGLKREVIIGTQDLSTSTPSQTILLPVGYRFFELMLCQIATDTDGAYLAFQLSADGGMTWLTTSSYREGLVYDNSATAMAYSYVAQNFGSLSNLESTLAIASGTGLAKLILFPGSASTTTSWTLTSGGWRNADGRIRSYITEGFATTGVKNALKYYPSAGNIVNCSLTVKGVV